MQKGKRTRTAEAAKRGKSNPHDLAIEERLAGCGRNEADHIVYVGELVERILKGEFGAVLKALTVGRVSSELQMSKDGKISSERVLGRIEMADGLWNDLEQYVHDKDRVRAPTLKDESVVAFNYSPE